MSNKVEVDKLAEKIVDSLEAYADATDEVLVEAIKMTCIETTAELAMNSPKQKTNGGTYSKNWTYTEPKKTKQNSFKATVYNRQGWLTHLLEYGHATRGGGRTKPQPHIEKSSNKAPDKLVYYIMRGLNKI